MERAFSHCEFTTDISKWNVSKVTNMRRMFKNSNFNGNISKWDVSSLNDAREMFAFSDFDSDINDWSVISLTDASEMFKSSAFTQSLFKWAIHPTARITDIVDDTYIDLKQCLLDENNRVQISTCDGCLTDIHVPGYPTFAPDSVVLKNQYGFDVVKKIRTSDDSIDKCLAKCLQNPSVFPGDSQIDSKTRCRYYSYDDVSDGCTLGFCIDAAHVDCSLWSNPAECQEQIALPLHKQPCFSLEQAGITNSPSNPCPYTHPYLELNTNWNKYWCYERAGRGGSVCRMTNSGFSSPAGAGWGTSQNDCVIDINVEMQNKDRDATPAIDIHLIHTIENCPLRDIGTAIDLYLNGIKPYGDISTWDVSYITDMSDLHLASKFSKSNPCPASRPYLEKHASSTLYYCFGSAGNSGGACRMSNSGMSAPSDGTWGTSHGDCPSGPRAIDTQIDLSAWEVSSVVTMKNMFGSLSAPLEVQTNVDLSTQFGLQFGDLSGWDIAKTVTMESMFENAGQVKGIENWDMTGVQDATNMFRGNKYFTTYLNKWNLARTDVTDMFKDATAWLVESTFDESLKVIDIKVVDSNIHDLVDKCLAEDMSGDCDGVMNLPMKDWDTSDVTDMSALFKNRRTFNVNISAWDVSSVTDFSEMFYGAEFFNYNLPWTTSSATKMDKMFFGASEFNGLIRGWNTAKVTSLKQMFYNAKRFTDDISDWNYNSVVDTSYVHFLTGADAFNARFECVRYYMRTSGRCTDDPGGEYLRQDECLTAYAAQDPKPWSYRYCMVGSSGSANIIKVLESCSGYLRLLLVIRNYMLNYGQEYCSWYRRCFCDPFGVTPQRGEI